MEVRVTQLSILNDSLNNIRDHAVPAGLIALIEEKCGDVKPGNFGFAKNGRIS